MRDRSMRNCIATRNQPRMIPLTYRIAVVVKRARWPDDETMLAWLRRLRVAIQIRLAVKMHEQKRKAFASMTYRGWTHDFVQAECFDMDSSWGGIFAIKVELRNRHTGVSISLNILRRFSADAII